MNGWGGFATHWSKLSVNRVTFLTTQKYLRDRFEQLLSFYQSIKIGTPVALVVSIVTLPLCMCWIEKNISQIFLGWPSSLYS